MIYRRIAVVGATAAAIVGVGTAALATSGSSTTSGSGTTKNAQSHNAQSHKANNKHKLRKQLLRRVVHGDIVTKGKDGYVVHSGIRGTVSSVSATSITVKAADGYTQTFTLNKDTKVRERPTSGKGRATAGKASDLKSGDKVAVLGKAAEKSSSKPSAVVVLDGIRLRK